MKYGCNITDVFRKYNQDIKGPSICVSQETDAKKSWLNVAEPGGDSTYVPNTTYQYKYQYTLTNLLNDDQFDSFNINSNNKATL
jgi:hypothetical protein